MAYYQNMGAAERFERARQIREQNLARAKALDPTYQAQRQAVQEEARRQEEDDYNVLERGLATGGDVLSSLVFGVAGGIEGIADLGLGVIGAIGGIFDDDFQNDIKDIIEYNATQEWLEKPFDEATDIKEASYLDTEDSIVRDVFRAVGGMLPSVAVSFVATPAAGLATMAGSAAGSGAQEAYAEGADFYEGLGYGAVSGAIEAGTEKLFGGLTSKVFGKGALSLGKSASKEIAETGVKRIVKGAAEEAAEEAIASAVNPLAKTIYKGSDALSEYGNPEYYKDLAKSAVVGALTAGTFGAVTGEFSKSRDVAAVSESIGNLRAIQREAHANDSLTPDVQAQIAQSAQQNLSNLEPILKKMDETKRAKALAQGGLTEYFEKDGTLKSDAVKRLAGTPDVESTIDRRYVSPEVWNNQETLQKELKDISDAVREKREDASLPDVAVFEGELEGNAKTAYKQLQKAVNSAANKTRTGLNLVLVKPNEGFSGVIQQTGNTVYIAEDTLEDGSWAKKFIHETTHFAEGTKEYANLIDSLKAADGETYARVIEELTGEGNGYGFTKEDLESLIINLNEGNEISARESELWTEINAALVEESIGNEAFIERIVAKDESLGRRILAKIKEWVEFFRTLGNKEARAEYKRLKQAESLWESAMEASGAKYRMAKATEAVNDRADQNQEETETEDAAEPANSIDNQHQIQYNLKRSLLRFKRSLLHKTFPSETESQSEAHRLAVWWAHSKGVQSGDQTLISMNNSWYVVERFEDADSGYQIEGFVEKSEINNVLKEIKKHGRSGRIKSIQGEIDASDRSDRQSGSYRRQKPSIDSDQVGHRGKNHQVVRLDQRKADRGERSGRNGAGDREGSSADRKGDSVKSQFSLKRDQKYIEAVKRGDAETAHALVKEAAEDAGYIPVVRFHQTGKQFNVFSNENPDAGLNDSDTPNGYFFKENDHDIGVGADFVKTGRGGNVQMAVYLKAGRMLYFENRDEARAWYSKNVPGYRELLEKYDKHLEDFEKVSSENNAQLFGELQRLEDSGNSTTELEMEILDKYDKIMDDWIDSRKAYEEGLRSSMRNLLNKYFIENDSGYDGIELADDGHRYIDMKREDVHTFIVFKNTQIKSADTVTYDDNGNIIPLSKRFDEKQSDIRFSAKPKLTPKDPFTAEVVKDWDKEIEEKPVKEVKETAEEKAARLKLAEETARRRNFNSEPRKAQAKANRTQRKVYAKKDAQELVSEIIVNNFNFGEVFGNLKGKSRQEVIKTLWKRMNEAGEDKQAGVALDIAEYIIREAVVEDAITDPANDYYTETVEMLKPYIRKLDLDGIRGEIKHKYDKRANAVLSRWGKRVGTVGVSPDVVAMELAELGYPIESTHPADILFEMQDAYQKAVEALKKSADTRLKDTLTVEEKKTLKQDIARDILLGFNTKGAESSIAKRVNQLQEQIDKQVEQIHDLKTGNRAENDLLYIVGKLDEVMKGKYRRNYETKDDRFKKSIGELTKLKTRGQLRAKGTRELLKDFDEWYNKDNPFFDKQSEDSVLESYYSENIKTMIWNIAHGEGKLNVQELQDLYTVVKYFKNMVENFDKVYKHGKYVEALPISREYVENVKKAKKIRIPFLWRWFESGYNRTFSDPLSLMKYADKYDPNGFFTETFQELEQAVIKMAVTEMELMEDYNKFFKNHKGYDKRLETGTIEYRNKKINVDAAIYLYMVTKSPHAWKGLVKSGFKVDVNGEMHTFAELVKPDEGASDLTEQQVEDLVDAMRGEIRAAFTKEDIAYLDTVERILNEKCSKLKEETDILRMGISNVSGEYYVPIIRANSQKEIESDNFWDEMNRVNSLSMNKDRIEGASGELLIIRASEVMTRHIKQVSMYNSIAIPIDNFNRLFKINVGDNAGKPLSVATELNDGKNAFYTETREYLTNLIQDIQGKRTDKNSKWFNDMMGKLRGGYAKFQLGANPKVLLTQTSSLIAAANVLDWSCIVKGTAVKVTQEDIAKYCKLAQHRRTDNTLVKAQSVTDKVGKVGDKLMTPIGWMDTFTINRLFGACQLQVAKDGGAAVGTEENKVAAGKLLERVILETQQNSITTERSAGMRSSNELLTAFTMFSADSMKMFGRFMDAFGERFTIGRLLKQEGLTEDERKSLEAQLAKSKKALRRATAVMTATAVFMALLGLAFRALYRKLKDKEPEEIVKATVADAVGNMLGGLPILRDMYSYFSDGYDMDVFATSVLNDTLAAAKKAYNLGIKAASGEPLSKQEVNTAIRDLIYSVSQLYGIPTRNAFNLVSGLTGTVSESAGYYIDDLFYKQSYSKHLKEAVEDEDERMIATITGLMIDEKVGTQDAETRRAMSKLIEEGYDVLPRSFSGTINNGDEQIELNRSEKSRFEKIYSTADTVVNDLTKLQSFQTADSEAQAKAIKFVYDTYYALAKDDILGTDTEEKNVLFAQAIDVEKLALIASVARSMKADTDKDGKTVNGSRQRKITAYIAGLKLTAAEKYMLMGYLGYTNTNGEAVVRSYINTLNLSNKEKQKLLEYSGYKKEA